MTIRGAAHLTPHPRPRPATTHVDSLDFGEIVHSTPYVLRLQGSHRNSIASNARASWGWAPPARRHWCAPDVLFRRPGCP